MSIYFRPLPRSDAPRDAAALPLAGGPLWFDTVVRHDRVAGTEETMRADALPDDWRRRLTRTRPAIGALTFERPHVMGILNVTPDSFSDGGRYRGPVQAVSAARAMMEAGATIIDVGGESTRPGAEPVPHEAEIARVEPVVAAVRSELSCMISIDTRKSAVAQAAVDAGARLINDVSGLTYDKMLAEYCVREGLPVCVMHARGDPKTMQDDPRYDDVLLDVYDYLAARVDALEAKGLPRERIIIDPGIGFGKTVAHNLALLKGAALFHGLGCAVLIGASRKGFLRAITGALRADGRQAGSVAAALWAASQGVQVLRVHDVVETVQALAVWSHLQDGAFS